MEFDKKLSFCKIKIISELVLSVYRIILQSGKKWHTIFWSLFLSFPMNIRGSDLPFYLWACQHDNQTHPLCAGVHRHSVHRPLYSMGPQKMVQNNDVHDDALIDIVVCERPLYDAASNRVALKYLQARGRDEKWKVKHLLVNKNTKWFFLWEKKISQKVIFKLF